MLISFSYQFIIIAGIIWKWLLPQAIKSRAGDHVTVAQTADMIVILQLFFVPTNAVTTPAKILIIIMSSFEI